MNAHIRTIHEGKKRKNLHFCKKCQYGFRTLSKLEFHVQHVHNEPNTKNFECSECHQRYKYALSLRTHYRLTHEIGKVKCPECNKLYKNEDVLKQHVSTVHNNEKKFKCDPCQKAFSQYNGLMWHKKSKSHQRILKE